MREESSCNLASVTMRSIISGSCHLMLIEKKLYTMASHRALLDSVITGGFQHYFSGELQGTAG